MVSLCNAFVTRGILSTPACDVHVGLKTTGGEKMCKGFLKFCKLISNLTALGQIIVSNLTNVHKLTA